MPIYHTSSVIFPENPTGLVLSDSGSWIAAGGSSVWGAITGSLLDQLDLASVLDGKASATHYHAVGDVSGLQTVLDGKSSVGHGHAISDTTGLQISLDGKSNTDHTHDGVGVPKIYVPIAIPVLAALAWTNMPAALSFWLSSATVAKCVTRVDLTGYTQVRLLVNKQGVAGNAGSKLILRYKGAPFTQAVANYSDIGTSEVSVAVSVLNIFLDTGWINLAGGAKADVFLALMGSGGNGALDPAFGYITAVFK